jgi:hypothetical protein
MFLVYVANEQTEQVFVTIAESKEKLIILLTNLNEQYNIIAIETIMANETAPYTFFLKEPEGIVYGKKN